MRAAKSVRVRNLPPQPSSESPTQRILSTQQFHPAAHNSPTNGSCPPLQPNMIASARDRIEARPTGGASNGYAVYRGCGPRTKTGTSSSESELVSMTRAPGSWKSRSSGPHWGGKRTVDWERSGQVINRVPWRGYRSQDPGALVRGSHPPKFHSGTNSNLSTERLILTIWTSARARVHQ